MPIGAAAGECYQGVFQCGIYDVHTVAGKSFSISVVIIMIVISIIISIVIIVTHMLPAKLPTGFQPSYPHASSQVAK